MASNILDTIMSIQPKEGGGGAGETRETVVFRMAEDMLDKLPSDYIPHEVSIKHTVLCLNAEQIENNTH